MNCPCEVGKRYFFVPSVEVLTLVGSMRPTVYFSLSAARAASEMLVISAIPYFWSKTRAKCLMLGWAVTLVAFFVLMYGGVFGLTPVDTDAWGGLPLTVILTLIGMTASVPIGILLALGRRTEMSALRVLSTGYIELVRGVPLITVLFVATYIFPLVCLPVGILMPFGAS